MVFHWLKSKSQLLTMVYESFQDLAPTSLSDSPFLITLQTCQASSFFLKCTKLIPAPGLYTCYFFLEDSATGESHIWFLLFTQLQHHLINLL